MRRVVAQLAGVGLQVDGLCAAVGLQREVLEAPGGRVPAPLLDALLERAVALSYDDHLGLHLAGVEGAEADAPVPTAMAPAATLREALALGARFLRQWGDAVRASFEETEEGVCVGFARLGPWRAAHRHLVDATLLQLVAGVRLLVGADVSPLRVRFAYPPPADTREHQRLFGCPLEFGAPASDVTYAHADAARPLRPRPGGG